MSFLSSWGLPFRKEDTVAQGTGQVKWQQTISVYQKELQKVERAGDKKTFKLKLEEKELVMRGVGRRAFQEEGGSILCKGPGVGKDVECVKDKASCPHNPENIFKVSTKKKRKTLCPFKCKK